MTWTEIIIQILTCSALVGLLGAVGLRLTLGEVKRALKRCRFAAILAVNFIVIPLLTVAAATGFGLKRETAIAMILLAASPFAPVVPVFARMARAELALAAALTGVFPLVSAFVTPLVTQLSLGILTQKTVIRFNPWTSLATLVITISLPLAAGVFVRHRAPFLGQCLLRPMEVISEAMGAASLAFVTVTQFSSITDLSWRAWLAMALVSEVSLFLGWQLGGPDPGTRQVVAFGTSNRNIALALLIAIQSFHGTAIASAVVGNGLLLIAFGLIHVAWWRYTGIPATSV
jgi:bile acid:Na+ symporter, BASS family